MRWSSRVLVGWLVVVVADLLTTARPATGACTVQPDPQNGAAVMILSGEGNATSTVAQLQALLNEHAVVMLFGDRNLPAWDLSSPGAAVQVPAGGQLLLRCVTLLNANLSATPSSAPLLNLPAFSVASGGSLVLHDVAVVAGSCSSLAQLQGRACTARASGDPTVAYDGSVTFVYQQQRTMLLQNVTVTCSSSSTAGGTNSNTTTGVATLLAPLPVASPPPCLVSRVADAASLYSALVDLFASGYQGNATYFATRNITADAVSWPAQVHINTSVTISGLPGSQSLTVLDWQDRIWLVDVTSAMDSPLTNLTFRNLAMANMAVNLDVPVTSSVRRLGIMSSSLWAVQRSSRRLALANITFLLPTDDVAFWSYWLTILASPYDGLRAKASWMGLAGTLALATTDGQDLHLKYLEGSVVVWLDITFSGSPLWPLLRTSSGILDFVTRNYYPPNCAWLVSDYTELVVAMLAAPQDQYVQAYGQLVFLRHNISMADPLNVTQLPARTAQESSFSLSISSMPGRLVCINHARALVTWNVTNRPAVILQNYVMENLPVVDLSLPQFMGDAFYATYGQLVSGLWMLLGYSPSAALGNTVNMTLVVPPGELLLYAQYLHAQRVLSSAAYAAVAQGLGSAVSQWSGRELNTAMSSWLLKAEIADWGPGWVQFSTLSTRRTYGNNVTLTVSPVCSTSMPVAATYEAFYGSSSSSSSNDDDTVVAVAVAVPLGCLAIAAVVGMALWRRRKRRASEQWPGAELSSKQPPAAADSSSHVPGGPSSRNASAGQHSSSSNTGEETGVPSGKLQALSSLASEARGSLTATSAGATNAKQQQQQQQANAAVNEPQPGDGVAVTVLPAPAVAALPLGLGEPQRRYGSYNRSGGSTPAAQLSGSVNSSQRISGSGVRKLGYQSSHSHASSAGSRQLQGLLQVPSRSHNHMSFEAQSDSTSMDFKELVVPTATMLGSQSSSTNAHASGARGSSSLGGLSASQQGSQGTGASSSHGTAAALAGVAARPESHVPPVPDGRAITIHPVPRQKSPPPGLSGQWPSTLPSTLPSTANSLVHRSMSALSIDTATSIALAHVTPLGMAVGVPTSGANALHPNTQQSNLQQQQNEETQIQTADHDERDDEQQQVEQQRLEQQEQRQGARRDVHATSKDGRADAQPQVTLLECIGRGGFASVHKGYWKGLTVAVKIITLHHGEPAERKLLEPVIMDSLQHDNIVLCYGFTTLPLFATDPSTGEREPSPCAWQVLLVQEFCSQGTLAQALAQGRLCGPDGAVDDVRVLETALDIASAMEHVHSKKVIHGDLSLANVLFQPSEALALPRASGLVAKVSDFGLSRSLPVGRSHVSRTMAGGTPLFVAPEVVLQGRISPSSDVWSFGAVLHSMYALSPGGSGRKGNKQAPQRASRAVPLEKPPATAAVQEHRSGSDGSVASSHGAARTPHLGSKNSGSSHASAPPAHAGSSGDREAPQSPALQSPSRTTSDGQPGPAKAAAALLPGRPPHTPLQPSLAPYVGPPGLSLLVARCTCRDPSGRPDFTTIRQELLAMLTETRARAAQGGAPPDGTPQPPPADDAPAPAPVAADVSNGATAI